MNADSLRYNIINEARSWIGTPYHHQAHLKGVGCDCLGLLIGVLSELYHITPDIPMSYSADWAECSNSEFFAEGLSQYTQSILPDQRQIGDVLLFRLQTKSIAKHAAILTENTKFIHAQERSGVCEVHLSHWWISRIAYVFRFLPQSIY